MAEADKLWTADDVAEYLGMTKPWVYAQVRRKRLPHLRLGKYVRFQQRTIEEWVQANEHQGTERRTPVHSEDAH